MGRISAPVPERNCTGSVSAKGDENSQNPRPCLQSPTSDGAGLELPIDHFRLLGVGPTTDAQAVLHALQLRIDRAPDQGFTHETLQAREDLLRSSADLLTDSQRRTAYEADLTTLAASGESVLPALDVPSTKEVGGLLLLLEAGQPLESFELASKALQPPQAPALGSGREADLALLAGLACLAAAAELHQQRRYEQAAKVLRQGLQLLQRMGQLPRIRQQISDELSGLRPYRVLDLLSRELASTGERAEGLALLEELVQERGGLEAESSTGLPASDFQTFFKQIRSYLTVQEQVDLFSRWGEGSTAANFLAATALTASGFAQRKPERIQDALERLQASGEDGVKPLIACLQLLLGDVTTALACFAAGADSQLRHWAEQQSDDPLAQLCLYCRDWLARDVLTGYRDLEADPDLEAYFADRDVQAWVERHDVRSRQAEPLAMADAITAREPSSQTDANPFASWTPSIAVSMPAAPVALPEPEESDEELWEPEAGPAWSWPASWHLPRFRRPELRLPELPSSSASLPGQGPRKAHPKRFWIAAGAGVGVLLIAGAIGLRLNRPTPTPLPVQPLAQPMPPAAPKPPAPAPEPVLPLNTEAPSEVQLRALLEAWLEAKAAVLAGREADRPVNSLAGPLQVRRLEQERAEDRAASTTQEITTTVEGLTIEERDANRIAATVQLRYADRRLDAAGQPVGKPSELQLTNRYVFGRGTDGIWRMVSFRKA